MPLPSSLERLPLLTVFTPNRSGDWVPGGPRVQVSTKLLCRRRCLGWHQVSTMGRAAMRRQRLARAANYSTNGRLCKGDRKHSRFLALDYPRSPYSQFDPKLTRN